jgi:hypothetical protein
MNSKDVLSKISRMLNLTSEEITLTEAKTTDGAILSSPTFDLGEKVEVVSEDGTKSPAPDGEHEIALKDSEGKEVIIRVVTKDGIITERENVEEAQPEIESELEDAAPMATPTTDVSMAKDNMEPAHALPNTTDEDPRNRVGPDTDDKKDPIISLTYRITELEDAIAELKMKFGEDKVEEVIKEEDVKLEEVEVKKLDGAPVEMSAVNLSGIHKPTTNRVGNSQNSFLSKLYN